MFANSLRLAKLLLRSPVHKIEINQGNPVKCLSKFYQFFNNYFIGERYMFKLIFRNQFVKLSSYIMKNQICCRNSINNISPLFTMSNFQDSKNAKLISSSFFNCNMLSQSLPNLICRKDFGNHRISVNRRFSTKSGMSDLHGPISSLKTKKRIQRKKRTIDEHSEENAEGFQISSHHTFQTFDPEILLPEFVIHKSSLREFQIVAYATADEYDLEKIADGFNQQGLYCLAPIAHHFNKESNLHSENAQKYFKHSEPENVLHFSATYHVTPECREMYIFRDGVVVFWNTPMLERKNILRFLQSYEDGPYAENVVHEEAETLIYAYTDLQTRLKPSQDLVLLNEHGPVHLEKFAFSNALAMSVKLGIWEASLDSYIDNIEFVTEELRTSGHVPLSEEQVLQRMGQLFALRHLINLSSDLLDTPDFYWEHETLAALFNKTANHLSIQKRTSVMNVKLGHCVELMDLLKSHLNQHHSARLEWIIIILIMIEIFFEILHFLR